jgi:hypothetical protein
MPAVGDTCILYHVDGADVPVCIPFASLNAGDFVFLMPDFNFDFLVQMPSYGEYLPPPEYSYHDFAMYVSNTGRWIYGDSGSPWVELKTDGSGFVQPRALFAFLFEDGGGPPIDCYIDVRVVDNAYFEIWAGSYNAGAGYDNYLYYKGTLLTHGRGYSLPGGMPAVHVTLPI